MNTGGCEVLRIAGPMDIGEAVARSAEVLTRGGVLLYPTDTIYGLGAIAEDAIAMKRIYAIKGKPETKPSLVLVDSVAMAARMAGEVPAAARRLMEACWPGPLTVVLRAAPAIDASLTAGTGKIGMRFPADGYCVGLVRRVGRAVVSTSANRSGVEPSARFDDLLEEFRGEVDLAVDGGDRAGRPSTVADLSGGTLVILREGAISGAELARIAAGKP